MVIQGLDVYFSAHSVGWICGALLHVLTHNVQDVSSWTSTGERSVPGHHGCDVFFNGANSLDIKFFHQDFGDIR